MLCYFTGIPGSGKSYYAVNTLYNNFSKEAKNQKTFKKKYEYCYTNINGLKYDKLENVYPLDFEVLLKCLTRLHKHYKAKKDDAYLIRLSKRYKVNNALFIIDECHNEFGDLKTVLVWWLTYHRHLYHDIYLITQNLALVHAKYKPIAEAFYKAVPRSLSFNPLYFKYKYYVGSRMTKADYVNTIKIKKRKEVFALYVSGDNVEVKNLILKFVVIAVLIFALVFGIFTFISSYFKKQASTKDASQNTVEQNTAFPHVKEVSVTPTSQQDNDDFLSKKMLILNCSFSTCSNRDISLPPQLVKKFIDMELFHLYYKEEINNTLVVYYLSVSNDFYTFLNSTKGGGYEKDSTDSDVSFFPDSK